MLEGSVQLALADLLTYVGVGGIALGGGTLIVLAPGASELFGTESLSLADGIALIVLSYVVGFTVDSVREWVDSVVIDAHDQYRRPFRWLLAVTNLEFLGYMKSCRSVYEQAQEEFTARFLEWGGRNGDLEIDEYLEADFADRNLTDPVYLARLGTLESFSASLSFVFAALAIGCLVRSIGASFTEWSIGSLTLCFLSLVLWGQQERMSLQIRRSRAVQGIVAILNEPRGRNE